MNILSFNVPESIILEINEFYESKYPINCYISSEDLLDDLIKSENNNVVVVKVKENDLSILRLIAEVKKEGAPIILLTDDYNMENRARYLLMGASIVLKFPCKAVEIIYTAEAISNENSSLKVKDQNFNIDYKERIIIFRGEEIKTTPQMFNLISYLVEHEQHVLTRVELRKVISSGESKGSDRQVDSLMKLIRKQTCHEIFKTVRGLGYMYKSSEE